MISIDRKCDKLLSIVIPARNEEALIGRTLESALWAAAEVDQQQCQEREIQLRNAPPVSPCLASPDQLPHLDGSAVEIIVVDDESVDGTSLVVRQFVERNGVRLVRCCARRAASARNLGASLARGQVLVFLDADTMMPRHALQRVTFWCWVTGYEVGIARLASLEPSWRAQAWFALWEQIRRLPLARAKAMPAWMFCTREAYDEFGPFDESVVLGEEWPILAGLYRQRRHCFIYDRDLTVFTSNRRMELQSCGYLRHFFRYVWAACHASGRHNHSDHIRHRPQPFQ